MRRAKAAVLDRHITALEPANLKVAFVTHLHSDHTAGYSDLILTGWIAGRHTPLEVYGPTGLRSMTEHILEAYEPVRTAYGPNYARLVEIKKKYDPTNVLRLNKNIKPVTLLNN